MNVRRIGPGGRRPGDNAPGTSVLWMLVLSAMLLAVPVAPAQTPEPVEAEPAAEDESLWTEVQALYEKAREAGEKVPGTVTEWVADDVQRIGDWEYKVVDLPSKATAAALEEQLNELGSERWEVFWVERTTDGRRVFLKRPSRSYVGAIPLTQILKLLTGGPDSGG